jgi:hypothetical protein
VSSFRRFVLLDVSKELAGGADVKGSTGDSSGLKPENAVDLDTGVVVAAPIRLAVPSIPRPRVVVSPR